MIREIFIRRIDDGSIIYHKAFTQTKDIAVETLERAFFEASKNLAEGEIEHTELVRFAFSYMRSGGYYFAMLFDRVVSQPERMESMLFLSSRFLSDVVDADDFNPEN